MKNDGISPSSTLPGTKRLRRYTCNRKIGFIGLILFFAVFVLISTVVATAEAGMVHGRVFLHGKAVSGVLVFQYTKNGQIFNVRTDRHGHYNVFLPPGFYTVTYGTWQARIRSYPNPVRQDIRW